MAHKRGHFAHECWPCQYLCCETRYVEGVTQPGTVADLIFHGCRLGGVSKLLEEARTCKRDELGRTQLMRAAKANDVERVRQLFQLGCPAAVIDAQNPDGSTALHYASSLATKPSCASCWRTARTSTSSLTAAGRRG